MPSEYCVISLATRQSKPKVDDNKWARRAFAYMRSIAEKKSLYVYKLDIIQ